MRLVLSVLATLLACGSGVSTAELFRTALLAADAGDPRAWTMCERLEIGKGRGECRVSASRSMPDPQRVEACGQIVREHWRNECWFRYAEDLAAAARWDDAIERCGHAGTYAGDCARHLWWTSQLDGTADPALYDKIVRAFPAEQGALGNGEATLRKIVADVAGQAGAEAALAEQTRLFAFDEARRGWGTKLRAGATCPQGADAACVAAKQAIFTERWTRALENNTEASRALCGKGGHIGARLATGGDADMEAALVVLQAERCPGVE